jgi:hypothetical protein
MRAVKILSDFRDGPGVCADGVEVAQHHHLDVAAVGALAVVLQELLLTQPSTMETTPAPVKGDSFRRFFELERTLYTTRAM